MTNPNKPNPESFYEKYYANQPYNPALRFQLQLEELSFNLDESWQMEGEHEHYVTKRFNLVFIGDTEKRASPGSEWGFHKSAIDDWFRLIGEKARLLGLSIAPSNEEELAELKNKTLSLAKNLHSRSPSVQQYLPIFASDSTEKKGVFVTLIGEVSSIYPINPGKVKYAHDNGITHKFKCYLLVRQMHLIAKDGVDKITFRSIDLP